MIAERVAFIAPNNPGPKGEEIAKYIDSKDQKRDNKKKDKKSDKAQKEAKEKEKGRGLGSPSHRRLDILGPFRKLASLGRARVGRGGGASSARGAGGARSLLRCRTGPSLSLKEQELSPCPWS